MTEGLVVPVVEVQQVPISKVNRYLQHGYLYLGYAQFAHSAVHGNDKPQGHASPHMYYIRRGIVHFVGRPPDVPAWEPEVKNTPVPEVNNLEQEGQT